MNPSRIEKATSAIASNTLNPIISLVKTQLDAIKLFKPSTITEYSISSDDLIKFTDLDVRVKTLETLIETVPSYSDFSELVFKAPEDRSDLENNLYNELCKKTIDLSQLTESELPNKAAVIQYLSENFGSTRFGIESLSEIQDEGIRTSLQAFFAYNFITPEKLLSELTAKKEALESYKAEEFDSLTFKNIEEFAKRPNIKEEHIQILFNILEESILGEFFTDFERGNFTFTIGDEKRVDIDQIPKPPTPSETESSAYKFYCMDTYNLIKKQLSLQSPGASPIAIQKKALLILSIDRQDFEANFVERFKIQQLLSPIQKDLEIKGITTGDMLTGIKGLARKEKTKNVHIELDDQNIEISKTMKQQFAMGDTVFPITTHEEIKVIADDTLQSKMSSSGFGQGMKK